MRLRRGDGEEELIALLERVVRNRPGLRVRILSWDFAMIYVLERRRKEALENARVHQTAVYPFLFIPIDSSDVYMAALGYNKCCCNGVRVGTDGNG
jgi:hypothetical protein